MSCKVSVLTITYNHEKFIRQTVESVMMQEADFEYEMVIGEDCSTDQTRKILLELRERYPERMRLLLHHENLGASLNTAEVLKACRGEYVAFLDGDDYFSCPAKLKKQADLLDSDPELTLCAHRHRDVYEKYGASTKVETSPVQNETWTIKDWLNGFHLHPSAIMVRRAVIGQLPDWFHEVQLGDVAIQLICLQQGHAGFINDVMSTYRIHDGGIWTLKTPCEQVDAAVRLWEQLAKHADVRYRPLIQRKIARMLISESSQHQSSGDIGKARMCLTRAARTAPLELFRSMRPCRLAVRLYAPSLYKTWKACRRRLKNHVR